MLGCAIVSFICLLFPSANALADPAPMGMEASVRQPDGRILVAGQGTAVEMPRRILVGRLNPDGSLDNSFGAGGWLAYLAGPWVAEFRVTAIAVAPDARIVVAVVQDGNVGLVRLNGDGSIDASFGNWGGPGLAVDDSSQGFRVNALALQAGGDILAVGSYTGTYTGNVAAPAIVRYSYSGFRDFSYGWGPNGTKLPFGALYTEDAELRAVAEWGDGAFVAAGYQKVAGARKILVARFTASGDLDPAFASAGWAIPAVGEAFGITVEPGPSILIAGRDNHEAYGHAASNAVVVKLDALGNADYSFGYGGMLQQQVFVDEYWDATATAMSAATIPGSGDLLVAGTVVQAATGRSYFFISRRELDYVEPFDSYTLAGPRTGADDGMTAAYANADGHIVAVGSRESSAGESGLRIRYFADNGDFDTDFPTEGADSTPNPFAFGSASGAGPGETSQSAIVRITGINVAVPVTIAGGTYSIGCGAAFTSDPGTVSNGQRLCVRLVSSTTAATTTEATLAVGAVPATFSVTTGSAPDTAIVNKPSDPSGGSVQFTYAASPWAGAFECRLDGAPFAACPSNGASYPQLAGGMHTFQVRASNDWGPDPTPASYTWTVASIPDTSITSAPSSPSASSSATIAFSSDSPGATFECRLDAGAYSPCSTPASYSGLANGTHTFQVRAVDASGADPTPASRTWTVDTVAPDVVIASGPSSPVASTTATFGFSASETVAYECSLDNSGFASCANPVTYSGLAEGAHQFAVRGRDAAGNLSTSYFANSRTWTVDLTGPETTILSGPAGTVASTSATFDFSSSEGSDSSFTCTLDGIVSDNCRPPVAYSGLSSGTHTFEVRARDWAGNPDPTPALRVWTIDVTAPDTFLTGGPNATTSNATATFEFSSDDPAASFQCRLDDGVYSPCASPATYALGDGSHTIAVRAVDAAGNVDPTPAARTWTLDRSVPDTTITSIQDFAGDAVTLHFSSSEPGATFECRLDGDFASCTTPASYSGLAEGSHTFQVRAIDAAGNVDSTPASFAWSFDHTPPETYITSSPTAWTSSQTSTFTFVSNEAGATFECRTEGDSGYAPCTSPKTYTALVQGNHFFWVRALDPAGNVDPNPAFYEWNVDVTAPETLITSGPAPSSSVSAATFTFQANEPNVSFECRIDAAPFAACASPVTYTGLGDGSHTFQVLARDAAQNADPTPGTLAWDVDTQAPETTISTGPAASTNALSASFNFTSTEPGTFECRLDMGAFAACASPKSYTALAAGTHTFQVRASDAAGNVDASPATWNWTVDLIAPDTTITGGPTGNNNPPTATFTFTSSEAGATFECRRDGGAFASCASGITYTGLSKGSHTFEVRARDAAGNLDATPATRTWRSS